MDLEGEFDPVYGFTRYEELEQGSCDYIRERFYQRYTSYTEESYST